MVVHSLNFQIHLWEIGAYLIQNRPHIQIDYLQVGEVVFVLLGRAIVKQKGRIGGEGV